MMRTIGRCHRLGAIFFNVAQIQSLEDLKRQYYKLAKTYHPDAGGTDELMKQLNNEYEKLFQQVSRGENLTAEEKQNETKISDVFREIINQIIKYPGLNIEIVGHWVWISGNTYPIRQALKEAEFLWASAKKMWFWRPEEYKSRSRDELSIEEIRRKYGSTLVNPSYQKSLKGIGALTNSLKKLQKLLSKQSKLAGIGSISDERVSNIDECLN
jgi:curved DNA-binding protein CbpA